MPPRVVGRAAELEVVDAFLAAVDDGPARLLVEGEPGIGKTTVWQAATARARERGFRILADVKLLKSFQQTKCGITFSA